MGNAEWGGGGGGLLEQPLSLGLRGELLGGWACTHCWVSFNDRGSQSRTRRPGQPELYMMQIRQLDATLKAVGKLPAIKWKGIRTIDYCKLYETFNKKKAVVSITLRNVMKTVIKHINLSGHGGEEVPLEEVSAPATPPVCRAQARSLSTPTSGLGEVAHLPASLPCCESVSHLKSACADTV